MEVEVIGGFNGREVSGCEVTGKRRTHNENKV